MSSIDGRTTPEKLAALVSEALEAAGIHAVLSGGGAVTIYTDNAYQSKDLDFVSSASTAIIMSTWQRCGHGRRRRVTLRSSRLSWSFSVLMPNQDETETSASIYL